MSDQVRILIRQGKELRRLATIRVTDRDGSIILVLTRSGQTTRQAWQLSRLSGVADKTNEIEDAPRATKVTLHSSGRVNYDNRHPPIYVEPIWYLTQPALILVHRIPEIGRLDEYHVLADSSDIVLDATGVVGPVSVEIGIAPIGGIPAPNTLFSLSLLDRLQIVITKVDTEELVPTELADHFVTFFPPHGTAAVQQLGEDEALISYMKLLYPAEVPMLSGPNGEGWYRLIFPVQMRIPPAARVIPVDESLSVEVGPQEFDKRSNRVQIRFRFRKADGRILKTTTEIQEIVLDAEF